MLLSVFTEQRNTGFEDKDLGDGSREFVSVGKAALQLREARGRVGILRPDAASLRVQPCDINGYPRGRAGPSEAPPRSPSNRERSST